MRKLKLIWDFRGPDSGRTAQHHELHLKDYIKLEKLEHDGTGFDVLTDMHSITFMIVDESEMIPIRDALKPHRGEVYTLEN